MSSPPNGRYKSKLFNFLSRKSRQLKDESDRALRNLKVAAVWGAQILLYPVYLLTQTSQLAGRQLQQATQEKFPQLQTSGKKDRARPKNPPPPPPADTPIQQVLLAIAGQEESELLLNPAANSVAASSNTGFFNQVADAINRVSTTYFGFKFFNHNAASGSSPSSSSNLILRPLNLPETVVVQTLQPKAAAGTSSGQSLAAALQNQTVVRGVATQLATRSVVLVTAENQILDILSPEQQQKLQHRIRWELANYWRQWRLAQASAAGMAAQLRPPVNQRHLLPPVRLFWGVIAWVQKGPVAIAANLFQESTLVPWQETSGEAEIGRQLSASREGIGTIPPFGKGKALHPSSSLLLQPLIFLDRTLAAIEVGQKGVLAKLTPRSGEIEVVERSPLQRIQAVFSQPIRQSASPDVTDAQAHNIQGLIQAAIDYFFGRRNGKLPWESTPELDSDSHIQTHQISGSASASLASGQRKNPELTATGVADPWLTMNDLFGKPDAPTSKQPAPTAPHRPLPRVAGKAQPSAHLPGKKARNALPGVSQPDLPAGDSLWKSIKLRLSFKQTLLTPRKPAAPEQMAARPTQTPSTTKKSRKKDTSGKITKAPAFQTPRVEAEGALSNLSPAIARSNRTSFATHSPDWIEAEVTPAGYVKHPLEYLLEWLDKAMLWLENFFVKVWRWVKKF